MMGNLRLSKIEEPGMQPDELWKKLDSFARETARMSTTLGRLAKVELKPAEQTCVLFLHQLIGRLQELQMEPSERGLSLANYTNKEYQ